MKPVTGKFQDVVVPQLKKVVTEDASGAAKHVTSPIDAAKAEEANKIYSDCMSAYAKPAIRYSKANGDFLEQGRVIKDGVVIKERFVGAPENPTVYRTVEDFRGNAKSLSEYSENGRITLTQGKNNTIKTEMESMEQVEKNEAKIREQAQLEAKSKEEQNMLNAFEALDNPKISYAKAGQNSGTEAIEQAAKKEGKTAEEKYDFQSDKPSIYRVVKDKNGNVESLSEKTQQGRVTLTKDKNGEIIMEEETPQIAWINDASAAAADMKFPF